MSEHLLAYSLDSFVVIVVDLEDSPAGFDQHMEFVAVHPGKSEENNPEGGCRCTLVASDHFHRSGLGNSFHMEDWHCLYDCTLLGFLVHLPKTLL